MPKKYSVVTPIATHTFNDDAWGNGVAYWMGIPYACFYDRRAKLYLVYLGDGMLYFTPEEFKTYFRPMK